MSGMTEDILKLLLVFLLPFLWWVLLFPVVCLLALPVVLAAALFRRGRYWASVKGMLSGVCGLWADWGLFIMP